MHLQIHNFSMSYADQGQGLPLLFIHGYPLSGRMWKPQVEGLSSAARILAPDLRGHGVSQAVPGPYWMDLLAGDLNAFLDALEISRPVVLCGLSMGGYVTFAFYRQFSPRLAAVILAATRAGEDSPEGKAGRDKAAELARKEGVGAIVASMLPKMLSPKTYQQKPELVQTAKSIMEETSLEGVVGDLMGMKARPDSTPTLRGIEVPTLILHGADDQLIPLKEAEAMRDAIPQASLEILPDAGHLLNLEQPELFNGAIRRFLAGLET
jgi:3-oxoadipate enol-lactonase